MSGKPLEITQYDSPLRFLIRSEEDPNKQYITDLEQWSCTCKSFKCRCAGPQGRDWARKTDYSCKHLALCFNYFAFNMRDVILEMYKNKHEND